MKVLIAGISTRAMSQSAVAAGWEVTSLDFFGDRDQPAQAAVLALGRDLHQPLTIPALAAAARELAGDSDAVMVASGLENDPAFLEAGWGSCPLLNASPRAVQLARDPQFLNGASAGTGAVIPRTIQPGAKLPTRGKWLVKDLSRSGGQGVRAWDGKPALPEGCVLQEYVDGALCSLVFVSDGKAAALIGMSQQYAGEDGLGAPPFAWCGNAAPYLDPAAGAILERFVQALVAETSLAGICGIDFILSGGIPHILEVNPRPGASLDLYEKLLGFNAFQAHVDALYGRMPAIPAFKPGQAAARGIVYACQDVMILDHPGWLSGRYADIPHPGETVPAGAPICSIYVQGCSAVECWEDILRRAGEPYRMAAPEG